MEKECSVPNSISDGNALPSDDKRKLCIAAFVSAANEGKAKMGYRELGGYIRAELGYELNSGNIRYHVNLLAQRRKPSILRRAGEGKFELVANPKFLVDFRGVENLGVAIGMRNDMNGRFAKKRWIDECANQFELEFNGVCLALELFDKCEALGLVKSHGDDFNVENFSLEMVAINQLELIHSALCIHRVKNKNNDSSKFDAHAIELGFSKK